MIDDSGSVRIPIAASLRSSSRRSPRSSSSDDAVARGRCSSPSSCSSRRRCRTVSPTRSSSVSIFSAGTRIERARRLRAPARPATTAAGSWDATGGAVAGALAAASSAISAAFGSPSPATCRRSASARAQQRIDELGSPAARAGVRPRAASSMTCARALTRRARPCRRAPLIVWTSRNSESTASGAALPLSSASSVSTMRSSRPLASSRKISMNSAVGLGSCRLRRRAERRARSTSTTPTSCPSSRIAPLRYSACRLLGVARERDDVGDLVDRKPGAAARRARRRRRAGGRSPAIASTRARSKTGSTWPRRLRTPSTAAPAPGTRGQRAELGDLEHVLDRHRVALARPRAAARGRRSCRRLEAAPSASPSPRASARAPRRARRRARAGDGALRLLGGELVGRASGSARSRPRPGRRPTSAAGSRGSTRRASWRSRPSARRPRAPAACPARWP